MNNYIERTNNGTTFVGSDVDIFGALALASAIGLYAKTKGAIKVSRMHTVTNMIAGATRYTGKTYKRDRNFAWCEEAIKDLREYADGLKDRIVVR